MERASKQIIDERSSSTRFLPSKHSKDFNIHPDANMNRVLEIVQRDPVVRGAITTLVDRTLEPGYDFYGKDKKSKNTSAVKKMGELRFDRLMVELLQHLFTYNNAFIEIVRLGEVPTELHMVDPRHIEPIVNKHGEIQGYVQRAADEIIGWTKDEIVHIKTSPLGNSVWGDIDVKALWTACALKHHIKKLYLWQYETNQFRPLLNIKGAKDEQVKRFLGFLDEARSDIKKLVPIEGEVETVFLDQVQDYSKAKELLTYLDFEILSLLQVPPIQIGLPDGSNRSSSDAEERAMNTRVKSIHRMLQDSTTFDLLPLLGFKKVELRFNTIDDKVMKDTLEMAERMNNMGMSDEVITTFLVDNGWEFPEGPVFDPDKKEEKSMDMFPSRAGKSEGEASEKIGVGGRGTTRDEQLISRGASTVAKENKDFLRNEEL